MATGPDGTPKGIRASVDEAFKVLGRTKTIDIFEMARVDPNVPIEDSVKALAELVEEGKIAGIGLSEVGANTIRKAHAVHPISAVEIELSLFTPEPLKNGISATCHERSYMQPDESEEGAPPLTASQSASPSWYTAQSAAAGWAESSASSTTSRRTTIAATCRVSSRTSSTRTSN